MKHFTLKTLATSISLMMASMGTAYASDIEIYKTPDAGRSTITMLIDTSGSMYYCDGVPGYTEGSNYTIKGEEKVFNETRTTKSGINYRLDYCVVDGKNYPSRRARLLDALMNLLDDPQLNENTHLAIGTFSSSRFGVINREAKPLTDDYKKELQSFLSGFTFGGSTPTASAYLETVAYMLGATTAFTGEVPLSSTPSQKDIYVRIKHDNHKDYYYKCRFWANDNRCINVLYAENSYLLPYNGSEYTIKKYDRNIAMPYTLGYLSRTGSDEALVLNSNELFISYDNSKTSWQRCNGNDPGGCFAGVGNPVIFKDDPDGNKEAGRLPYKNYNEVTCKRWSQKTCLIPKDSAPTIPKFDLAYWSSQYSGFSKSTRNAKTSDGSKYRSPLPTTGLECSGQAIYLLTDGIASHTAPIEVPINQMLGKEALSINHYDYFSPYKNGVIEDRINGLIQSAELSKIINNPATNPKGVSIKTALVGFGSIFDAAARHKKTLTVPNSDPVKTRTYYDCNKISDTSTKSICNWGEKAHSSLPGVGGYGEGGFFHARSAQDIIDSFKEVVKEAAPNFQPITTGAPTIPIDSLNLQRFSNKAYYASFIPRPDKAQQLWVGDINKYNVADGRLIGQSNKPLFENSGVIDATTVGLWGANGAKGNIPLQKNRAGDFQRVLYTNRTTNTTGISSNSNTLSKVSTQSLTHDRAKNYWLNLLGYNIGKDDTVNMNRLSAPELRQVGAIMHSKPILLTQSGQVGIDVNRDDYLLFGSTQGLLHIVDADTGAEKFAFVPHEMVENQKEAFLQESSTSGGKSRLFYGIDAPWVAHTQYVSKNDGTLTVNESDITYLKDTDPNTPIHLRGLQWVYGGLRMGGKSYYSLDLSDMDNPTLKFHIDPTNKKIHSSDSIINNRTYDELKHMGQSWSKPTIGYVNWYKLDGNKERRLVMFVGGGYDNGYENSNYDQTNGVGAGVYMFDANTGALLWWASNNSATSTTDVIKHSATGDDTSDLQYSTVSRINAIDRNNDGLIDHLYFGDLGGQGFRIDLDNNANSNANFSKRVVRILNEHQANGLSPRFYEAPSVSIHKENGNTIAAAAFGSGDRSSPLAGPNSNIYGDSVSRNSQTANDGVFVVYDQDVARQNLFALAMTGLHTRAVSNKTLASADFVNGVPVANTTLGWKFIYNQNPNRVRAGANSTYESGDVKSFDEPYAITNLLFVNTYNRKGTGIEGQCGSGIIGTSQTYQLCLPTGQCKQDKHGYVVTSNTVSTSTENIGMVSTTLGGNNDGDGSSNVSTRGHSNPRTIKPEDYRNENPSTLRQLRWYESRLGG